MNIDLFKAIFWKGFAKANLYRVFLPAMGGFSPERLNIMCDSVAWPGKLIKTTEHATAMLETKRPYAYGFESLSVSFLLGNDWTAWDYIKFWQNMIIEGTETGQDNFVEYKNVYQKNIVIEHLDSEHKVQRRIELVNAYPVSVQSMELSNTASNQIMRVIVQFDYDYWRTI
jgi:hypothetical protein